MLILCSATSWYGLVVRSYTSFKLLKSSAMENPQVNDALIKEALHFWIAFALIALFESYMEIFVSWIPLYSLAKFALLWYIILPQTKGSTVVFENLIEPRFRSKLKEFEVALLEVIHTHVLTYTKPQLLHDVGTEAVNHQNLADDELDQVLDRAQRVLQAAALEKQRRASQLQQEREEEFVVVRPVPFAAAAAAPPPSPPQQQVFRPSYLPSRGLSHTTSRVMEAVYVEDVPVVMAELVVETEEEVESLADETLDMMDSPSSVDGIRRRLSSWMPGPGWPGVLSFASSSSSSSPSPATHTRAPPPPPSSQPQLEQEEERVSPTRQRRSSSRLRTASETATEHVPPTGSFTNRILTRRQAAAAAAAANRH